LYKCHDKGREGSPTYDGAGFELDWEKVNNWMDVQRYNKSRMVRDMEKAVDQAKSEEQKMFELFFTTVWNDDRGSGTIVKDYVTDKVSKDLSIPWH
jgi:hypothetical protein